LLAENVKLLVRLYVRPRSTMPRIIDEGSFLFGALVVLGVTLLLTGGGVLLGGLRDYEAAAALEDGAPAPSAPTQAHVAAPAEAAEEPVAASTPALPAVFGLWSGLGAFSLLAGMIVLYVPALILVMSVADARTGSFGVALRRDYGSIGPCILMCAAAAELLFGGMWMGVSRVLPASHTSEGVITALIAFAAVAGLGVVYFAVLAWMAVRTVWGTHPLIAAAAVIVPFAVMPFAGLLSMLASPFLAYWIFMWVRGDISAIQWSMGSRRAFKRHMEASTLNPLDADPHYQLGLIHQQRRQHAEAIAHLQKAVEIDRSHVDAHFQLGRIAREQARHADAIRHFEQVVARDPKYARHEIWREVGATYFEAGDFANARTTLQRYIDNRPYDAEGLCLLGVALKKLGETTAADDVLKRCLEAIKTAPGYRRGELRRWRKQAEAEL
jgi:hypothetical protein